MSADGASRRALLSGAAAALALGVSGCGGKSPTDHKLARELSPQAAQRDIAILTGALELERRTVAAYVAGIPLLTRDDAKTAEQFLSEELEHTGELISLITAAGGKPGPRANSYEIGSPQDDAGVIALLHSLERLQLAAYLRWIPQLSPGPVRAAVATILTVDSQHIALWRLAQGENPVPAAFVSAGL